MSATIAGSTKVDASIAAKITANIEALNGKTGADATAAANALAESVKAGGSASFTECGVVSTLHKMLGDRTTAEPALCAIQALAEVCGEKAEVFLTPFLPSILTAVADKKSKEVREAAAAAGPAVIKIVNPHGVKNVQPFLFAGIAETNWQTKLLSLQRSRVRAGLAVQRLDVGSDLSRDGRVDLGSARDRGGHELHGARKMSGSRGD